MASLSPVCQLSITAAATKSMLSTWSTVNAISSCSARAHARERPISLLDSSLDTVCLSRMVFFVAHNPLLVCA